MACSCGFSTYVVSAPLDACLSPRIPGERSRRPRPCESWRSAAAIAPELRRRAASVDLAEVEKESALLVADVDDEPGLEGVGVDQADIEGRSRAAHYGRNQDVEMAKVRVAERASS
jgi:hypothetical protein